MKTLVVVLALIFFSSTIFAQKDSLHDPQNIKVITTREPFYPKGEQALYTEVLYGIKYSEESKKKYIEGEVTLSFDVLADSTVSNCILISDVGYGVGEEVKKYVQQLKFAPAIQLGVPVKMNVMWNFPVKAH